MEIAIIKLMQKLDIIPEHMGQMMEQTANSREQLPSPGYPQQGQIPQGGLLPGGNPLELLQLQQLQQMQQMQMQQMQMQGQGKR